MKTFLFFLLFTFLGFYLLVVPQIENQCTELGGEILLTARGISCFSVEKIDW